MNLIQHLKDHFLQVAEKIISFLEGGIDYPTFQQELKKELNKLGQNICREVLEAADQYLKENRRERKGWVVQRSSEEKNILTPFGLVTYSRTYYRNKETGEYAHLVDRLAGYGPHARVDAALKAELIAKATEISYRKSVAEQEKNAPGTAVSAQTVMNAIRSYFARKTENTGGVPRKKIVRVLYIEADEDHVARQKGKKLQIPLIYVHEGWEAKENGYRLKNVRYFSGLYADIELLWLEVWDYIESNYDVENIERIYVAGDGASWIKKGLVVLPKACFVLDRFHLEKYILRALGKEKDKKEELREALRRFDLPRAQQILKKAQENAPSKHKKKAVAECRRYIKSNWEGIEIYRKYPGELKGCSAEGHVSHILSARLSRRPGGWSKKGADQMARLRVIKGNGEEVKEKYLAQRTPLGKAAIKICPQH